MASVNPNILAQIFGQEGVINQASPDQTQRMIAMLAGAGSGMTQASAQPGANFAQALGGGAQGMMAGRTQSLQQQQAQLALQQQQQQMADSERRAKAWQRILGGAPGDFASQVDARPAQTAQLTNGATITPVAPRGQVTAQPMPQGQVPIGILGGMFESNQDPAAISTGEGDPGGASYGQYQLASGTGTLQAFFESPEGRPFATQFGDLEPGSERFNQIWREVATDERAGPAFQQAQQAFMERTHFGPALERAQRAGLDVSNPGVREAVVSMGTQHSPAGNMQIMNDAMARLPQNATPDQVVDALYEARSSYVRNLPEEGENGLPRQTKENILNRYSRERMAAQQLTGTQRTVAGGGQQVPAQAQGVLGGQPPQNGYQQRGGGAQGLLAGLPPGAQQLLGLLGPEAGAQLLAEQMFASPAEQPAAVREALFMAGGDENMARRIMLEKQMAGDQSATEAKIQRLMDADPDLDRPTAVAIADGRYVVSRDPISGTAQILDKASGQQVGQTTQAELNAYENPPKQDLIPEDLDLTKATGVGGTLRKLWNRVRDTAGMGLTESGEEAEQAIQALSNLSLQTEVALAQEVPGRPSNYLLERLRQVTVEPARLFEGPGIARERLRATTSLVDQKLAIVNDVVQNPGEYRPAEVSQARRNKTQLEYLKEQYDAAFRIFSEGPDSSAQGAGAMFSDEDRALIERWSQ